MLYCNENHQLVLLSNVDNTSLSKPQLSTIPVLSPTISMSSLTTVSTSDSTSTFALRHVVQSKKKSLYTPRRYDDIFDRIDLSDFQDTLSTNNSISTCSIPSLEYDKTQKSCLKIHYKIENNDHPLFPEEKLIQPFPKQINIKSNISTKQSSFSLINFFNSVIKKEKLDIKQLLVKINNNEFELKESKQLETFNTILKPIEIFDDSTFSATLFNKPRESRLNSSFLKIFAIHKSIQSKSSNVDINTEFYYNTFINSNFHSIDEFFYKFNITNHEIKSFLKFNFLSRNKLNSMVILPARKDMFKHNHQINKLNYYKNNSNCFTIKNGSIIRNNGKQMPWYNFQNLNYKKSYPPIGFLPNNTQYTVKNWENKRWSSV